MRIAILQIGSRAGAFEPTVDRMLDRAAAVAAQVAMVRLSPTALIIASSWNNSLYQRVDQPAQTVTSLELLNE